MTHEELRKERDELRKALGIVSREATALRSQVATLREALRDLATRCDGDEGVRADGSNIDTLAAHAALGDLDEVMG